MGEKISDVLDYFGENLFMIAGCLFFLMAALIFLGYKVNPNFLIYPLEAIGIIALLAGLLMFGLAGLVLIPILGLPVLLGVGLVLSIVELFPMLFVVAFIILGIFCMAMNSYVE